VLEERYEERLEDHAAELAQHFAHSSDPADLARAVAYGEIAAQRAISLNAYSEAVRHLEQALEMQGVLDPEHRERRCALLPALGDVEGIFWSGARLLFRFWAPGQHAELVRLAAELVSRPREGVSSRTLEVLLRRAQIIFLTAGDRERAEACWAELDHLASHTQ